MTKFIFSLAFCLAACGGGSGGGSGADSTATSTTTSTGTDTSTSSGPKIADLVGVLAQVQLCKTVSEQPAAVQALLAQPYTYSSATTLQMPGFTPPSMKVTIYEQKSNGGGAQSASEPYYDGTTETGCTDSCSHSIFWNITVSTDSVATNKVVQTYYAANSNPTVGSTLVSTCP